jgi:hypothetical protein
MRKTLCKLLPVISTLLMLFCSCGSTESSSSVLPPYEGMYDSDGNYYYTKDQVNTQMEEAEFLVYIESDEKYYPILPRDDYYTYHDREILLHCPKNEESAKLPTINMGYGNDRIIVYQNESNERIGDFPYWGPYVDSGNYTIGLHIPDHGGVDGFLPYIGPHLYDRTKTTALGSAQNTLQYEDTYLSVDRLFINGVPLSEDMLGYYYDAYSLVNSDYLKLQKDEKITLSYHDETNTAEYELIADTKVYLPAIDGITFQRGGYKSHFAPPWYKYADEENRAQSLEGFHFFTDYLPLPELPGIYGFIIGGNAYFVECVDEKHPEAVVPK